MSTRKTGERTTRDVAAELGMYPSQVGQIEHRAIEKIRGLLSALYDQELSHEETRVLVRWALSEEGSQWN